MRIRTIKPEFWLHEGLCSLPEFSRLLALALLNWADDEGYFMANPAILRGALFPFLDDSKKVPRSLEDLSSVGWIELGTDNQGRKIGRIANFTKHQRVDKPKPSEIKDSSAFWDASKNDPGPFQGGMEQGTGNGMEEEQGVERDSPLSTWTPSKLQLGVGGWFGRKPTTEWSARELKAWKDFNPDADDLTLLDAFYSLDAPPEARNFYRRNDLLTFLNNWRGEIDRARQFFANNPNLDPR